MEVIDLNKRRDFGGVLNVTFGFIKQEIGLYFKVLLTYTAIPLVGSVVLVAYLALQFTRGQVQALFVSPSSSQVLTVGLPVVLFWLSLVVVNLMVVGVTYGYLNAYKKSGKGGFGMADVGRQIGRKFFPILGYSIVVSIVVMAGLVLFILPGIYLAVALSTIYMVMFYEDKGLARNFNRCFTLIKNNWWVTFGLILIAYIIVNTLSTVFILPFQIYMQLKITQVVQSGDISQINIPMIAFLFMLMIIGSTYLSAFVHLVKGIQYFNLNGELMNESIEDRINKIGERSLENEF